MQSCDLVAPAARGSAALQKREQWAMAGRSRMALRVQTVSVEMWGKVVITGIIIIMTGCELQG